MDGHIRIKTKLDNSEIPKDLDKMIKELERLKQEQKELNDEAKKLDLNAKDYEKNANKIEAKIKELQEEQEKLKAFQEYSFNQEEYNDYGRQVAQKQQEIDLLKQEEDAYDKTLGQLEEVKYKLEENKEAQADWNKAIEQTKERLAQADSIKSAIGSIGIGIKGLLKKTLRWGLAIFSVRSAYMLIRQTVSTLSQYNEQLATDLQYIRFSIANALEPVIRKIVDWVYLLMSYVNYILKAWFNIDLNDGAKKFKSMSKSAKEIKNSLAGFDEMNVLTDNSGGGAGGGIAEPRKFDLENIPKWLEQVGNIGKVIKVGLIGFDEMVRKIENGIKIVKEMFNDAFTTIKAGFIIAGTFISTVFENVKLSISNAFTTIGIVAKTTWETIKNAFSTVATFFGTAFGNAWKAIKNAFSTVGEFFDGIWKKIKSKFSEIGTKIGDSVSSAFKTVINSVINFAQNTINKFIKAINKAISAINVIPGVNIKKITEINIPKLATGGIVNRPTYAQIGEAGREAVLPLDRNTEWMNELAKKINANGGTVNVYLDGRLIQRQYNQRQEEFNFATNGGM